MPDTPARDPRFEWLDHVRPVGLVVAQSVLEHLGLTPTAQTGADSALVAEIIGEDDDGPVLADPWRFMQRVLGWEARLVAGAPGGPPLDAGLDVALPEHETILKPTWAVKQAAGSESAQPWQLLVQVETSGIDPDDRGSLDGWEATAQQRFERLLRETGVFAGLLISERKKEEDGETSFLPEIRLVYAPRGETSGYLAFPLRPMGTVAGRSMLGGLKLLLAAFRLFSAGPEHRLPKLLADSREAQAAVSEKLSGQVLGALYELLRGLDAADSEMIRDLAGRDPNELYDGLLAILMRLVFILYAEDRDLLPSRADARALYEQAYSVRGLYAKLAEDAALNPDTMDERRGGWGRLLALFRLIHAGHPSGFIQRRAGDLFDPNTHPFLEGRRKVAEPPRMLEVSDGCLLRVLEGMLTLKARGGARERLSYRTLDVEQIGSVYETVMGFRAELAGGEALAVKGAKGLPFFLELDAFAAKKGKERIKAFHELTGASLSGARAAAVEAAPTRDELIAALTPLIDERASPGGVTAEKGKPILQPTEERRRTGSHYTPRSLTAPIVEHALAPAFDRLGENARPEDILALKVCDPAMGSAAFLVEACRAIAERLTQAWTRHPGTRPTVPVDEDEALFARRLAAQRCLYGVDKNPRAVELARLSLWLATLAKDHEFTFLDHALKCGDSLVGLDRAQIAATHWDASKPPTLVGRLVSEHLREAEVGRARIREQAEWASEAELRPQLRAVDAKTSVARLIGDGVVAAFFSADKPRKRAGRLAEFQTAVMNHLGNSDWSAAITPFTRNLSTGEHRIPPFHWQIEFPEVFSRDNPGFDAIVGNPPFAGKNTISAGNRVNYLPWLQTLHAGAHGNSDLVAHFFRRAFRLLRGGGVSGLIATNTIAQGDTRVSGLTAILAQGGSIRRAIKRLKWPGEAAVVVSVVHVANGESPAPMLDGQSVQRISAYLVEGLLDGNPAQLAENAHRAFKGSELQGMGFTFDDALSQSSSSLSLQDMRDLISRAPWCAARISPYLGGEEINNDPAQKHHRFVIDLNDLGADVAAKEYPELLDIVREFVKPGRDILKGNVDAERRRDRWWKWSRFNPELYSTISSLDRVVATIFTSPHFCFSILTSKQIFANSVVVIALEDINSFSVLQSRVHELWARYFSSTLEDRLRYAPSDCFRTFPFPRAYAASPALEAAGAAYHEQRASLMIERNEGLTKTYNRFHARTERAPDIVRLRELHEEMDRAVLAAYGWEDLAERAAPDFQPREDDPEKTRFDWPQAFKDEVLARLLDLNRDRAAEERALGRAAASEDDADAQDIGGDED